MEGTLRRKQPFSTSARGGGQQLGVSPAPCESSRGAGTPPPRLSASTAMNGKMTCREKWCWWWWWCGGERGGGDWYIMYFQHVSLINYDSRFLRFHSQMLLFGSMLYNFTVLKYWAQCEDIIVKHSLQSKVGVAFISREIKMTFTVVKSGTDNN